MQFKKYPKKSIFSTNRRGDQSTTLKSQWKDFSEILINFAQYEREVIGERIHDKVAAAKRRGKYCGGVPPLGYDVDRDKKKLLVNPEEATLIQLIFRRYNQVGSAQKVAQELNKEGYKTKSWTTKKGLNEKEPNGIPRKYIAS